MNDRYGQPTGYGGPGGEGGGPVPGVIGRGPGVIGGGGGVIGGGRGGWAHDPGYNANPYGDPSLRAVPQRLGNGPQRLHGNDSPQQLHANDSPQRLHANDSPQRLHANDGPQRLQANDNSNYPGGPPGVGTGGLPQNGRRPSASQGIPSPPQSISRSSDGATLYTTSEPGPVRKGSVPEHLLQQHYVSLKSFVEPEPANEKSGNKTTKAKDKLLKLSPTQFQELSTDVFDELNRREAQEGRHGQPPGQAEPYLLPKESFHPKRNQARQKLSTLQPPRFKDLAGDVFYELQRRFPNFEDEGRPPSPVPSMPGRPSSRGSPLEFGVNQDRSGPGQAMGMGPGPGPGLGMRSDMSPERGPVMGMNMGPGPGAGLGMGPGPGMRNDMGPDPSLDRGPGPGPGQGMDGRQMPGPGLPGNGPRGGPGPFPRRPTGGSIASLNGPGPAQPNQNQTQNQPPNSRFEFDDGGVGPLPHSRYDGPNGGARYGRESPGPGQNPNSRFDGPRPPPNNRFEEAERGPSPNGRFNSPTPNIAHGPDGRPYDSTSQSSSEYARPQPKTFQSNTIVPNISTMVEDDDDQSGDEGTDTRGGSFESGRLGTGFGLPGNIQRQSDDHGAAMAIPPNHFDQKMRDDFDAQIKDLRSALEDSEATITEKNDQLARLGNNERSAREDLERERQDWERSRHDLEDKLANAKEETHALRDELERYKTDHINMERELRGQIEMARGHANEGSTILKEQLDTLARENENLRNDLQEQQHVTDEVREQAAQFLKEMQALSAGGGGNWDREEELDAELARHRDESKMWKTRYTRTKTQLRNLRASSIGLSLAPAATHQYAKDDTFTAADGLVKDIHITKFQIAIDELLRAARTSETGLVLDHIKTVILAVRSITQGVPDLPPSDGALAHERSKIKSRVSATANNLITASKNFASSNGISPVSLLDAAASHLTAAVVDLVKTVKIRPTPAGELEDDDDGSLPPGDSPSMFSMPNGRMSGDSMYSMGSRLNDKQSWMSRGSPTRGAGRSTPDQGRRALPRRDDQDMDELKMQLDGQMQGLYTSIQALVSSIRIGDDMPILRGHINDISELVRKVVVTTDNATRQPDRAVLRTKADGILQNLSDCRNKILRAASAGERITNQDEFREFTNDLPAIAFEIVRETKELVRRLDESSAGQRISEEDFR